MSYPASPYGQATARHRLMVLRNPINMLWILRYHGRCQIPIPGIASAADPHRYVDVPTATRAMASYDSGVMKRINPSRPIQLLLILLLLPVGQSVSAAEGLVLRLGAVAGPGWRAENVSLMIDAGGDSEGSLGLNVGRLQLPVLGTLDNLEIRCRRASISLTLLACPDGMITLGAPGSAVRALPLTFSWDALVQAWVLRVPGTLVADATFDLQGSGESGEWQMLVSVTGLPAATLTAVLAEKYELPPVESADGHATFHLKVSGGSAGWRGVIGVELSGFAFSDATGAHAADALDLSFEMALESASGPGREPGGEGGRFKARLNSAVGEVFVDPVYLNLADNPLVSVAEGSWADGRVDMHRLHMVLARVGALNGQLTGRTSPAPGVENLTIELEETPLKPLYEALLQPYLVGGALERLDAGGRVGVGLSWRPDEIRVDARLRDIQLDDQAGRFGVHGLSGDFHWASTGLAPPSHLRWDGGVLYRLDFGQARLAAAVTADGFALSESAAVPILDGELRIDGLSAERLGTEQSAWRFSGELAPVSMERLTAALGWPPFGGEFGGQIPAVRYGDGTVSLDGELRMSVFDGAVAISKLRLERPLDVAPVLSADIALEDIALTDLTRAFSFGDIQGRLEGHVRDLVLVDWHPRSFDAEFRTPEDDDSRHRISQRAVDDLAGLGGAQGAISRTFLRFFDAFSYDRLGLSCRLESGVCEMGGIAPAERGYYIVRGAGVPRIDVMGFNRRIDWTILLDRLRAVTQSDGPVVR